MTQIGQIGYTDVSVEAVSPKQKTRSSMNGVHPMVHMHYQVRDSDPCEGGSHCVAMFRYKEDAVAYAKVKDKWLQLRGDE